MTGSWIKSLRDVERLVEGQIPESGTLEYKSVLALTTKTERGEMLKDLSGMANGGGGTLVFGIQEADGIPTKIVPLGDRGIVGRLEDVVRSGIRPPLAMTHRLVEHDEGFILVVEVFSSELGPYMVDAYGRQGYYIRQGSRTAPMTEQQIRDAYALAHRGRERRQQVWEEHDLPLRPPEREYPWMTVSALPREPLTDVLDLSRTLPEKFAPPAHWLDDLACMGSFHRSTSTDSLRRWRDGLFGAYQNFGAWQLFRLHCDGAICLGHRVACLRDEAVLPGRPDEKPALKLPWYVLFRAVNAQLVYLGWIWEKLGLRVPVEIHVALWNLQDATVSAELLGEFGRDRRIERPPGVTEARLSNVSMQWEVLPWELGRASVRHRLVRDFADRLHQAFGAMRAGPMFRCGWLYGPDGSYTGFSLTGGEIRDELGYRKATVHEDGVIRSDLTSNSPVAFVVDGVVLDLEGKAMAALEMSTGAGLPDNFLVRRPLDDRPPSSVGCHGSLFPATGHPPPDFLGQWSTTPLLNALSG